MIYRILFVYLVGFVIFAVLNTGVLYWGGNKPKDAEIVGATLAVFWFIEIPLILLNLLKGGKDKWFGL